MGKYSNIAVAALMALAITGCASEGEQASNPSSTATPSAAPASPSASQPFNNPVVAGKPQSQSPATIVGTPNLIQTTNATERLLVVSKGGSERDPFAQITPPIPIVPNDGERRLVPVVSGVPTPNRNVTVVSSKQTAKSRVLNNSTTKPYIPPSYIAQRKPVTLAKASPGFVPVLPKIMPQVVPNTSLISVLPPAAQPELAKGVVVTGVVMVGRTPQAIIKVPTESTSRYVQSGDRLGSGLLVKRIEMNEGSDPIVIFEQFGIEVARMVGEGATGSATTASADSATPAPANNVPTGAS
ncbi:hypothetical protein [Calothrix sp. PCC 6303]|uniref:hypothetical protein n=1 Tax=Calothrix sp. PCC 6303 TaxID=1170562 RepID=UPI0002A03536|nr:hypothetical protein [Calothrix sp. PCC 6303]AFY99887.1 hypothetical protein Cal6303_0822 [Calothrix sp. PCC 6303]